MSIGDSTHPTHRNTQHAKNGGRSGKGAAGDFKMASSFSLSRSRDVLIGNEASPNLQC